MHALLAEHALGQHDACTVDSAVLAEQVPNWATACSKRASTVTGALLRARPSVGGVP